LRSNARFAIFAYLEYNERGLIRLAARGEMLDERSDRRRKRLTAMSSAAPGIEAEAVSGAVRFMASSAPAMSPDERHVVMAIAVSDAVYAAVFKALGGNE